MSKSESPCFVESLACVGMGKSFCVDNRQVQNILAYFVIFLLPVFQVANLACSISNNEEGVKLVRMAATQIDSLCPQVKTYKSTSVP